MGLHFEQDNPLRHRCLQASVKHHQQVLRSGISTGLINTCALVCLHNRLPDQLCRETNVPLEDEDCDSHFRFGQNAKVVHFLGKNKPWSYTYDPKSKRISGNVSSAAAHPSFLLDWWKLYSSTVVPALQEQFGDQPFHSGCVEVTEPLSSFSLSLISLTFVAPPGQQQL